jgi:anti-sigma regulatory factor (Ser/Thr protein kinase)
VTGGVGAALATPYAGPAMPGSDPASIYVLRLSALDLRPLPTAVPCARLHARQVVQEWGFPAVATDCELIVAEIVTNAITHGTGESTAVDPPPVRLRLGGRPRGVQIEVWDSSDKMPKRCSDPLGEGGRGLILVEALSSRWGAYRAEGGGKVVWAVIGA